MKRSILVVGTLAVSIVLGGLAHRIFAQEGAATAGAPGESRKEMGPFLVVEHPPQQGVDPDDSPTIVVFKDDDARTNYSLLFDLVFLPKLPFEQMPKVFTPDLYAAWVTQKVKKAAQEHNTPFDWDAVHSAALAQIQGDLQGHTAVVDRTAIH